MQLLPAFAWFEVRNYLRRQCAGLARGLCVEVGDVAGGAQVIGLPRGRLLAPTCGQYERSNSDRCVIWDLRACSGLPPLNEQRPWSLKSLRRVSLGAYLGGPSRLSRIYLGKFIAFARA